jgi:hypothetical protein
VMDKNSNNDLKAVWQNQPAEQIRMTSQLLRKRSNQLRQERRNAPFAVAAVVLFIVLLSYWKFQLERNLWYDLGLIGAAAWTVSPTAGCVFGQQRRFLSIGAHRSSFTLEGDVGVGRAGVSGVGLIGSPVGH